MFYRLIQSSWGNALLWLNNRKYCILSCIVSRIDRVVYKIKLVKTFFLKNKLKQNQNMNEIQHQKQQQLQHVAGEAS